MEPSSKRGGIACSGHGSQFWEALQMANQSVCWNFYNSNMPSFKGSKIMKLANQERRKTRYQDSKYWLEKM
jgi:hypothetical protein